LKPDKVKYPKVSDEKNKRRKYTKKDTELVKKLLKSGLSGYKISQKYGLKHMFVWRIQNPKQYKVRSKKVKIANAKRYRTDPTYKQKIINSNKRTLARRKKEDPEFLAWHRAVVRNWHRLHPNYSSERKKRIADESS